jgi:aminopeptidase N
MGDEDHVAGPSAGFERGDDAAVAGADVVDTDHVGMLGKQRRGQGHDPLVVVAAFAYRQKSKRRKIAGDDLLEADLALAVIAERDRAADQPDLAGAPGKKAAEERGGCAPGGGIVDADIVGAVGARRVGNERHHGDTGCGQVVDRLADRRVVEGDHGDAIDLALQAVEREGEGLAVEDVDFGDLDVDALVGERVGRGANALFQRLHEGVVAGRQQEAEAVVATTGEARREAVGTIFEQADCRLDALGGLGVYAGPAIEDAIDRRQTYPGSSGNVLQGHPRHLTGPPFTVLISRPPGECNSAIRHARQDDGRTSAGMRKLSCARWRRGGKPTRTGRNQPLPRTPAEPMMKTETAPVRLADYRAPDFAIETVDLDVILDPQRTRVTARLVLRPRALGATSLVLVGDELKLVSVALDGGALPADRYRATPEQLTIMGVPERQFTLEIVTELDPSANTKLMGLYRSGNAYCTQCEAEGFRRITYFLDRPDVLSVYTTRLEAPKSETALLSNGNPVEQGDVPGSDRHYAIWHDPFPKPAYLFALVAGDLGVIEDTFTTMSGRQVALRIYCEHGKEARCAYAMEALKRSMRWDETAFGREYDLDIFMIVAVSDFNMGAMENKGLNIFNDKYVLADSDTATDVDFAHVEGVIAHEYFHNWTGNRITCRDWFQLCLKEGLTVYRDQEFSADTRSRAVKRISDVRTLQARQFPEDAGPLAHPVRPETYHEINNFYTPTVYEKGAEVVRMLRTILGDDGFRSGMDLYFTRHDGEAATVEDFLAAFADETGADLNQFKLWYAQSGTPEVVARGQYDERKRTYTLNLSQTCPPTPGQKVKQPMHIPIRFGLVGPNGADLAYESATGARVAGDVIHLTEPNQAIVFRGVSTAPVPSLLRGFSAPVRLSIDLKPEELLFLVRADADPFNRWQAAQMLAYRTLIAGSAAAARGEPIETDRAFIDALGEVAQNEDLEPAFRAQVLQLPGEADIAREIGHDVDPDAIFAARRAMRAAIALRVGATLTAVVDRLGRASAYSPYAPDAAGAGKRALLNTALDLLVAGGDRDAVDQAVMRCFGADNLTDRLAALSILTHAALPERHAELQIFHDRYRDDHLVLDKWLALEATVPAPETLDRVRALLADPSFAATNPNRIRALVGSFASGNQTQFNRADGAGYEFLADFVLDLDKRNPQTAARLLISFRSWRALEEGRRLRAGMALRRIADADRLSPDVSDIVTRTLA